MINIPVISFRNFGHTKYAMKRVLTLLLLAMLIFCMPAAGENLYIVHTNDVHGHLADNLGYAAAAAVIDDLRQKGEVILLDAGDALHGTQEAIEYQGASVVEIMNLMDYDGMALGNHEFDYALDTLREREAEMAFPILSANARYENGIAAFTEHIILERGGYKVGIFGLTTPSVPTSTRHGKDLPFSFAEGEALFALAQQQVDTLSASGCDLIICLCHLGLDDFDAPNTADAVAKAVDGIDLIIDGHSHTRLDCGLAVSDTLIVSSGEYLESIGVVTVSEDGTLSAELIDESSAVNPAVEALVNGYIEETQERYNIAVGESKVFLDGNRNPGVRTKETNLGDLCADAMLYAVCDAEFFADAAIVNGGGIRTSLEAGTLTRYDLLQVLPFNNLVSVITVPGSVVLEVLEANTAVSPSEDGGFPQVAGIRYTIDTGKPYVEGEINRVSIQEIAGKPFSETAEYRIAVTEFLAGGGDKYAAFTPYYTGDTTGILDSETLELYITEVLGGVVGEEYEEHDSRIIYGTAAESPLPFTGILAGLAFSLLLVRRR